MREREGTPKRKKIKKAFPLVIEFRGGKRMKVEISGKAVIPDVSLKESKLDFGNVTLGGAGFGKFFFQCFILCQNNIKNFCIILHYFFFQTFCKKRKIFFFFVFRFFFFNKAKRQIAIDNHGSIPAILYLNITKYPEFSIEYPSEWNELAADDSR